MIRISTIQELEQFQAAEKAWFVAMNEAHRHDYDLSIISRNWVYLETLAGMPFSEKEEEVMRLAVDWSHALCNTPPKFGKDEQITIQYACTTSILYSLQNRRNMIGENEQSFLDMAKTIFTYFNTYFSQAVCAIVANKFALMFPDVVETGLVTLTSPNFKH